jgi:hypothetical protein
MGGLDHTGAAIDAAIADADAAVEIAVDAIRHASATR